MVLPGDYTYLNTQTLSCLNSGPLSLTLSHSQIHTKHLSASASSQNSIGLVLETNKKEERIIRSTGLKQRVTNRTPCVHLILSTLLVTAIQYCSGVLRSELPLLAPYVALALPYSPQPPLIRSYCLQ